MYPCYQSQKRRPGKPQDIYKQERLATCAVFVCDTASVGLSRPSPPPLPCSIASACTCNEGPPRQQQQRRRRRLPLLHRLHVAVLRRRRRPAREDQAATKHGRLRGKWRRRRGHVDEGRDAGVAGDRHGWGAEAREGDQEPVRRRRGGGGGGGGAGDGDRVPDGRAARRAHRLGRAEQGRRRQGHGERLLPLPQAARGGHGSRRACLKPSHQVSACLCLWCWWK